MPRKKKIFWALDCETDPFARGRIPEPFIWGAYNGEEYITFECPTQVADFFRGQKTLVYAHNGGKFDYHFMREFVNTDDPIMLINGRMAKFRIGECEFRDSLNIFPNTRLKDFGIKDEIDYLLMEKSLRSLPENWEKIQRYLRQDCVGLWEMVNRYRDEYGISLTQAGASMRRFERMYGMKSPRQSKAQHQLYKPYYYGGRVQCFKSGTACSDFKVADINSAYPFAMLSSHPWSPLALVSSDLPKDKFIPQCLITLKGSARGSLPWRDPDNLNELYFPEDDGKSRLYHVTGWEYLKALELNALTVHSIEKVHHFPLRIDFKDYIHYFFEKREEARKNKDIAGRTFCKYFMNSLYGKFGANPENYAEYVIASTDSMTEWESKGFKWYKNWGDRFLMERQPTEDELNDIESQKWRYYNVATAASITGFVRSYLFDALSKCGDVLYCDTDSIAAKSVSDLEFGPSLGQWKDEGNFDQYSIAGKKLYAFHYTGAETAYDPNYETKGLTPTWKIASKGVNFSKLKNAPELIAQIANGDKIEFEPEIPTFSITRNEPRFINRVISYTAKDMSRVTH